MGTTAAFSDGSARPDGTYPLETAAFISARLTSAGACDSSAAATTGAAEAAIDTLPLAAKDSASGLEAEAPSWPASPAELERWRPRDRLEAEEPGACCISGVRTRRGSEPSIGLGGAEAVCLTASAAAAIAAETIATWAAEGATAASSPPGRARPDPAVMSTTFIFPFPGRGSLTLDTGTPRASCGMRL